MEKAKTAPHLRVTDHRFYQYAWFYHMKYVTPQVVSTGDELLVVAASIATKNKQKDFAAAVSDVMTQSATKNAFVTASWPAESDPCLQVADYCCWAIQRKWESGDLRSYNLIANKVRSEFNLFAYGSTLYY